MIKIVHVENGPSTSKFPKTQELAEKCSTSTDNLENQRNDEIVITIVHDEAEPSTSQHLKTQTFAEKFFADDKEKDEGLTHPIPIPLLTKVVPYRGAYCDKKDFLHNQKVEDGEQVVVT